MSLSKKQFLKNSTWTLLELVLYPLLMIIATPVFIKYLGIEQYGLWMLVTTITIGMNLLNIGVGETNIRLISSYRAINDAEAIKRVFNYNFSFSWILCFFAGLLGLVFYLTDFISIFYKSPDYHFANTILLLASFSTGLKFVEVCALSVFKAFERFDLSARLLLISKNSVMLLSLVLVLSGYDLINILECTVILNILNIVIQLLLLNRFNPGIVVLPGLSSLYNRLDTVNYNLWYWLQSSIALTGFLADKLLVAYLTDVKTLGYYSIASLIGTNIHNFFLSFGSFIFPRVSFKMAENKDVSPLYLISRSLVALPGWSLIVCLLLFGDIVFRMWLGNETFINSIYYIKLYLIYEAGMLLIIVPFYFINGSSQIRLNTFFEALIRSSHLIGMLVGYYFYGVYGILYGLIISTFINVPFQYFYFHRSLVKKVNTLQFLWVYLPVILIAGLLIFGNIFLQITLIICFIFVCKVIYFDPARKYSKGVFDFSRYFKPQEG